jgi:pimeloyl-ACP methyl ester carboxylesterase
VSDPSQGVQLGDVAGADALLGDLTRLVVTARRKLNALPQFKTEIDGVDIHFIHVKSRHENALPLIITHGWPGSVIELIDVVGPVTDPTAHGGSTADAFDLVLPSVPGYGFSGEPKEVGWDPARIARAWTTILPGFDASECVLADTA